MRGRWRRVCRRVQSVAVRLIVERERRSDAFMPEEYWKIGRDILCGHSGGAGRGGGVAKFLAQTDPMRQRPDAPGAAGILGPGTRRSGRNWPSGGAEVQRRRYRCRRRRRQRPLGLTRAGSPPTGTTPGAGAGQRTWRPDGSCANFPWDQASGLSPSFVVENISQRESRPRPPGPFTTAAFSRPPACNCGSGRRGPCRIARSALRGRGRARRGQRRPDTYMRTDSLNLF